MKVGRIYLIFLYEIKIKLIEMGNKRNMFFFVFTKWWFKSRFHSHITQSQFPVKSAAEKLLTIWLKFEIANAIIFTLVDRSYCKLY